MLDRILIGSSAEPSDPDFENVTLLLHGDGSNGAQNNTFLDSSTNNFTITRNGNTTQGSFTPYGASWSNYFDGNADWLSVSDNAAFGFGTGDFTIEAWVLCGFNGAIQTIVDGRPSNTAIPWALSISSTGLARSYDGTVRTGGQLTANQWNHVAWVRVSGVNSVYVNGVLGHSWTNSGDYGSSRPLNIGRTISPGTDYLNGYLSNLRIVKGTAVYTAAFTPPTAPLTAITNTSLLTCQSNRFRDASTNNFTITRNGDVKVTNFAPFAPTSAYSTSTNGGSAYFDGTGDYLQTPSDTAFTFSGSLTIEFWINFSSTPSNYVALVAGTTANTQLFITTKINGTGLRFGLSGVAEYATGSETWAAGAWYHVALVRNGTDVRFYVNGVNVTDGTATNSTSYSGAFLLGGNVGGTVNFPGYISNLRVVKGTAVYTAAFTPPTAPVTAITNTSLLLNATNAAIFDNSMKNDLETVGNAQISTSVKKFGTGSLAFDGTGDYLVLPPNSQSVLLGSASFTVEFWINPNSSQTSTRTPIVSFGNGFTTNVWAIQLNNTSPSYVNRIQLWAYNLNSGAVFAASTGTISASTWTHVAVVRNGSNFTIYINGVADGTGTSSASMDGGSTTLQFQVGYNSPDYYAGYIDDLRITNGVARYTANFTPPTAAFPNK